MGRSRIDGRVHRDHRPPTPRCSPVEGRCALLIVVAGGFVFIALLIALASQTLLSRSTAQILYDVEHPAGEKR